MHKNKKLYYLGLVLLAFLVSVFIRMPNLNRPLSKHHEFNMAMVLNVCNSWELRGGPAAVHFCPVIDYGNAGDRYFGPHEMLKDGKLYYASLGSLQFLLPYYFCKILGLPFTPLSIQYFAICTGLLLVIVAYFIFALLLQKHQKKYLLAAKGSILLLFLPNYLWFFSNGYVHESLVLVFYGMVIYFFVQQYRTNKPLLNGQVLLLNLTIAAGIGTDWLMVFVAAGYGIFNLICFQKQKKRLYLWQALGLGLTTILSIAIIFYLYSTELGVGNFKDMFLQKFQSRTIAGANEKAGWGFIVLQLTKNFVISYLPLLLVLGWFMVKKKIPKNYRLAHPLYLILLYPPLLYTLLFTEFSAEHDYAFLKFGFLLVVAFLYGSVQMVGNFFRFAWIGTIILSLGIYFYVNRIGTISRNGDAYDHNARTGSFIAKNCPPVQHIFTNLAKDNLHAVIYYAKRNVRYFSSAEETMQHVQTYQITYAVFVSDSAGQFTIKQMP